MIILLIQAVIIVILILIICDSKESYVVSPLDGRAYNVLEEFDDKEIAADKLAHINELNQTLIQYMLDNNKPGTHPYILGERLKKRYRPDKLIENDPPDKDNTSYTEDKGKLLALCLRHKDAHNNANHNSIHDDNIIMFVSIHELAHISSLDYGHEDEFWDNFKILLENADAGGFYNTQNYQTNPVNYCGLDVTFNPMFER